MAGMPVKANRMLPNSLWFSLAVIMVIIFGTIYAVVQQSQRMAGDYPQIQLAEDAAASLNAGQQPSRLTAGRVNMHDSLAPFITVYSRSGQVVVGNGYLNGHVSTAPFGI